MKNYMLSENFLKQISVKKLKARIDEKGISTLALEREAGLKRNVIQNILVGKSKRPHTKTLQAICDVLKCRPEEITLYEYDNEALEHFSPKEIVKRKLFSSCINEASSFLDVIEIEVTFEEFFDIIRQIYEYNIENNIGDSADQNFVKWFIKKKLGII